MKKRAFLSIFLTLVLMTGIVPAAAAELPAPEGLSITWYTDYEGLMRRYGTDRMLLVKDGKSGLFGLDGTKYTDCVFDAFGTFNGSGLAPACLNGKWGMVDLDGKTVVDFIYATAHNAEERTGAQVVQEPGGWKYAIADMDGNLLTPYKYWSTAKAFSNGMLAVFIDKDEDGNSLGWGYVNEKGEEVIPCRYYSGGVGEFGEDGLAIVYNGAPYGYNVVDKEGRELLKEGAGRIWRAGCGLFGFSANFSPDDGSSVGFFDTEGNIVIEPQFAYRTNPKGMMQGNIFYEETGLAQVYQNGESFTIDTQGNRTDKADAFPDEDYVYAYHEGLVWENAEGRRDGGLWPGPWGFRDEKNNLVVPYAFDAVGYFDRGVAVVKSGDTFGLLKNPLTTPAQAEPPAGEGPFAGLDITWVDTENQLSTEGYDNLIREFHIIDYRYGRGGPFPYGDYGLRNANGQEVTPVLYGTTLPGGPGYDAFAVKEETLADGTVQQTDFLGRTSEKKDRPDWDPAVPSAYKEPSPDGHDKWGFNNPWTGEIVLPAIYDAADDFSEGIAVVEKDGRQYAIDEQGKELFDLSQYRFVGKFSEGRAWVRHVDPFGEGFIDTTGKEIIPAQWDTWDMEEFREGYVTVWDLETDLAAILDRDNNFLIPAILDGATQFESGVAVITYQGRQGILKNPDLKHKTSDWAAEEIAAATEAGYVTPSCATYQTFTITRAQFAELAVNFVEKKTGKAIDPAPADTFTDTADETILKAYAAGIVQGMGDGIFGPGRPLTREQLATMLWRAMEKVGVTAAPAELSSYTDNDKVSDWARDSVAALAGLKVMEGTGASELSPKNSCTVEQAILLVYRAAN